MARYSSKLSEILQNVKCSLKLRNRIFWYNLINKIKYGIDEEKRFIDVLFTKIILTNFCQFVKKNYFEFQRFLHYIIYDIPNFFFFFNYAPCTATWARVTAS